MRILATAFPLAWLAGSVWLLTWLTNNAPFLTLPAFVICIVFAFYVTSLIKRRSQS